jgi:hypothetical protein
MDSLGEVSAITSTLAGKKPRKSTGLATLLSKSMAFSSARVGVNLLIALALAQRIDQG